MTYPQFDFNPSCFFAIGSPIGMFVTVRGFGSIGDKYALPTCGGFFNIFHPVSAECYHLLHMYFAWGNCELEGC